MYLKGHDALCRNDLARCIQLAFTTLPVNTENIEAEVAWSTYIEAKLANIYGHTKAPSFRIVKDPVFGVRIWSKDSPCDNGPWRGRADDISKPFVLIDAKDMPSLDDIKENMPSAVPKTIPPKEIALLKAGLESCRGRMRNLEGAEDSYTECLSVIETMEKAEVVPFHWTNGGRYDKETKQLDADDEIQIEEQKQLALRPDSPPVAHLSHVRIRNSSKKKRKRKGEETIEEVIPDIGDFVVVRADTEDSKQTQRFWIGQVTEVKEEDENGVPKQLQLHWFSATKEFGEPSNFLVLSAYLNTPFFAFSGTYNPCFLEEPAEAGKIAKRRKGAWIDDISFMVVMYVFEKLNNKKQIPEKHAKNIRNLIS